MLVAIADQLLAPVPGGTGRYTRELLRAMAATAPAGWELATVVSRSGDPAAARIPGVAGPRVLPLPRRALSAAWEHGLPLWPGGDAVHAMTPLAPPVRNRHLVVTVHDTVAWTCPQTLTRRGAHWHRRMIARAARNAAALVVPTSAVAADLARRLPVRAAVRVIGEGVPAALTAPPADADARSAQLDLPERYVLAVGTVEPRKGFDWLVRAMARPEAPDVPLLVAGRPGWGQLDLQRIAEESGMAQQLRLLGPVSDAELAVLLHRASALAAPSLDEGFGLPVVEAMACGVPVVHSDAPALVEVAGGAGSVVPRTDPAALAVALRTAVEDRERRNEMITAGYRRAGQFSWEKAAKQVWELHQEIAESPRL